MSLYLFDLTVSRPMARAVPLIAGSFGLLSAHFSPDSRWLAATETRDTHLWRLDSNGHGMDTQLGRSVSPVFSPDGRWLAGLSDGRTWVWDLTGDAPVPVNKDLPNPPEVAARPVGMLPPHVDLAFIPNTAELASIGGATVRIRDARSADTLGTFRDLPHHGRRILHFATSPNGRWVASGSDRDARLWDLRAANPGQPSRELVQQGEHVAGLGFSPDGRWLAVEREDRLDLWRFADEPVLASSSEFPPTRVTGFSQIVFSEAGSWFAVTRSGQVFVGQLDVEGGALLRLSQSDSPLARVAFTTNGEWLLALSDRNLRGWSLENVRHRRLEPLLFSNRLGGVGEFAVSRDGHWLATAEGSEIRLWDLTAQDPGARWVALPVNAPGISPDLVRLEFSPQSTGTRWLATGIVGLVGQGAEGAVQVWTLDQAELLRLASRVSGRNMTPNEWQSSLGALPYRRTFPDLPVPSPCDTTDGIGSRSAYERARVAHTTMLDTFSGLAWIGTCFAIFVISFLIRSLRKTGDRTPTG
jgi:WD40 repeat protein